MFEKLGQFMNLAGMLPRIKEETAKLQERLGQMSTEGDAGAGMVKVRVNGKLEVLACTLTDEALEANDREMLESLIRAATNQAIAKMRQQIAEETHKTMSSIGLPAGMLPPDMGLPGLG